LREKISISLGYNILGGSGEQRWLLTFRSRQSTRRVYGGRRNEKRGPSGLRHRNTLDCRGGGIPPRAISAGPRGPRNPSDRNTPDARAAASPERGSRATGAEAPRYQRNEPGFVRNEPGFVAQVNWVIAATRLTCGLRKYPRCSCLLRLVR